MKDLIEDWRQNRSAHLNAFKKVLSKISTKKSKELDKMATEFDQEVFEEIDCLSCANCCKTIPPILNKTDVKRISSHLKMKEATFIKHYVTIDEDQDQVMNQSPCPFLGVDNYCGIYEVKPKACREYPHTHQKGFLAKKKLHLQNVATCPAVFHVLKNIEIRLSGGR